MAYLARGIGYSLLLTTQAITFSFAEKSTHVQLRFIDANTMVNPVGKVKQDSYSHYYLGNDSAHWKEWVPHFQRVRYASIYPGVD